MWYEYIDENQMILINFDSIVQIVRRDSNVRLDTLDGKSYYLRYDTKDEALKSYSKIAKELKVKGLIMN